MSKDFSLTITEIFNEIKGDTYQEKLNTLNLCNCCEKHKINRPKIFEPWKELPFHNRQDIQCPCDCRHMARFICRQHPDYCRPSVF
jgi:hypothetical protein